MGAPDTQCIDRVHVACQGNHAHALTERACFRYLPRLCAQTQEIPSLIVFVVMLLLFSTPDSFLQHPLSARTVLSGAFCAHYVYRSIVFPFIIRGGKPTPLSVWAMSFVFCIWNGFIQVSNGRE